MTDKGKQSRKRTVFRDQQGVTSLEYAVLGIFLILGLIVFIPNLAPHIQGAFMTVGNGL